ncbi:glucose 1-dehydrogenase [Breoghania sp. L-A4]|uniref:SDR family NAD(P)-dependent oxidoreductase n=1 Tax=Breoghania sp. L-A4 TaxID=2304600 RepID=UPI000E360AD0|nr:glucose 1-dehydrogenase [Breoghania sp. L-A4]AXS41963.1 SDR family oxidoreductase [Breoghania sp. L-A4]
MSGGSCDGRYSGKTVLLTGAAGGFGRAAALRFASEGAALFLSDLDEAGLADTVALLPEGAQARATRCDVADEASVAAMVDDALAAFGRIDVAVNNAGIAHRHAKIADTDLQTFDRMLAVNLRGVFLCLRAELNAMKARGGVILNVSSVAGVLGAPLLGAYAASKHGVIGLTKTAAAEAARDNIRVNALCPSYADTAMLTDLTVTMRGTHEDATARLVRGIPMQRLVTATEVAAAMAWLCCDENSFMTGHAVRLDGGGTAV